LLRLALDEPDGLEGLVRRFEADRRRARPSYEAEDAESKLSHLDDLRRLVRGFVRLPTVCPVLQ
jgi:hypothetical protein